MKNIVTIRHTQSVQHTNGMIGSWTDWELTDLGKAQAESIGRKLSTELADKFPVETCKIYSSDLLRARQTAEPLSRVMGIPIGLCERLREINYGSACGKSKQWARENRLSANHFNEPEYPGAESWLAFWNRVADIQKRIIADEAQTIIIVSHAGTLKVWEEIWSGSEPRILTDYGKSGGVSFFRMDKSGVKTVIRLNDLSYSNEL